MRTIVIAGLDAPRRATAEIISLRRQGVDIAVQLLTGPDDDRLPDSERSFPSACGKLLRNDAFWLEWASGRPLFAPAPAVAEALIVVSRDQAASALPPKDLPSDAYGRPLHPRAATRSCRVGILGRAEEQGAVLAALGDAADRVGVAVQPVFFRGEMPELDAVLLPGGADMAPVESQITAADAAIRADLPLFGLCLGMQCIATALMRQTWPGTTLEEVAGPGPRRSFVRWRDPAGIPAHRLGDRPFHPAPGTRLAELLPDGATVRMNHRYHLAPDAALPGCVRLHPGKEGPMDAIELSDRRFCLGLQGHPELGCDPALGRLWDEFLHAALQT